LLLFTYHLTLSTNQRYIVDFYNLRDMVMTYISCITHVMIDIHIV